MKAASIEDYRRLARRRLPRMLFDYIDGGANEERTLARNAGDFGQIRLRQRVLTDTSRLDTGIGTFGLGWSMPVGLAPVGLAGMYSRRGEVQAARAAAAAGVPFCLSNASICSIEEVARATDSPAWFQLSTWNDRDYVKAVLGRARDANAPVLVFTIDVPRMGLRYRDAHSGMFATGLEGVAARLRDGILHPGWVWDVWLRGRPLTFGNLIAALPPHERGSRKAMQAWQGANLARAIQWSEIAWLRDHWQGPIVVKGILDDEDARLARQTGMDGIIVSNHGGRQLDGVSSTIAALPSIVEAVGADMPIFLDGGVRSGIDVLKALAIGATACFIGRPWAWALAASGEKGVRAALEIIRTELETAMILTGCTSASEAGRHILDERQALHPRTVT